MTQPPAKGARRITTLALLTAIALTIFMAEAQMAPVFAIPGIKLGLANIVTVYAVFVLGPGDALLILAARVFLGAVFSGQMSTLLYSAGGGALAWLVMVVLSKLLTRLVLGICLLIFGGKIASARSKAKTQLGNGNQSHTLCLNGLADDGIGIHHGANFLHSGA